MKWVRCFAAVLIQALVPVLNNVIQMLSALMSEMSFLLFVMLLLTKIYRYTYGTNKWQYILLGVRWLGTVAWWIQRATSWSHYALPNVFCISAISFNMYSQCVFSTEQLFDSPNNTVTLHCILNNTVFKHERGEPIGRSLVIRIRLPYSLGASLLK